MRVRPPGCVDVRQGVDVLPVGVCLAHLASQFHELGVRRGNPGAQRFAFERVVGDQHVEHVGADLPRIIDVSAEQVGAAEHVDIHGALAMVEPFIVVTAHQPSTPVNSAVAPNPASNVARMPPRMATAYHVRTLFVARRFRASGVAFR